MKYLIIGASSGLGRELGEKFASEGHHLIIVSRDKRDLEAIKSNLEIRNKVKIDILALDFSSIDEINSKLLSQKKLFENLNGIIFPIGMMFSEDNFNLDTENIKKIIYANFISIAFLIQKLKKYFIKQDNSCLIGFGSISGFIGRDINITYAGAKRGRESYFESLAFDKNLNKTNIQFYTLGYLETNLSFGKDLKLPRSSVKKLANLVYKNKNRKFKKIYYPRYWIIVRFLIQVLPHSILRKMNIK